VLSYLEEVDLLGHPVVLRILWLNAQTDLITDLDDVTQLMAVEGDGESVIFTLGLDELRKHYRACDDKDRIPGHPR
jgi:hypothetical protein